MKQNIIAGLGYRGTELIARLRGDGKRAFTVKDGVDALGGNPHAVANLLYNLVKRKKLLRLERGKYLIIPPEAWRSGEYLEEGMVLASHLVSPCYLSFWTALNYYGYTEQPSKTVFVATTKAKLPLTIKGVRFQFIQFKPEKFFGFEKKWLDNDRINIASREKTVIDCLDQTRYCGDITEAVKGIWHGRNDLNYEVLVQYAEQMGNRSVKKRLGYLLEMLGIDQAAAIEQLRRNLSKGYSPLDPSGSKHGKHNSRWQLLVNVDSKSLTEWQEH